MYEGNNRQTAYFAGAECSVYVLVCAVQCLVCMIVTMTVKMMMNPICRDAARKVATRSTVSQLGPEQQKCIQFADKEAVKDTDPASRVWKHGIKP